MIEYKNGDIFNEDVEAIVNSVNCVGVMGRGIALQFKNMFPENFKAYSDACKHKEVQPGRMFVFETGQLTNPRYIINFPTKRHWRGKSRMEDIESGLKSLSEAIKERNIRSIAIPPIGSDLGGLLWNEVRPRIEAMLEEHESIEAIILGPGSAPSDGRPNQSTDVPDMTLGRAALIGLVHQYLSGLLDPFVTLLEVHKLMYFMQEAGEPLRLRYAKAHHGPYAENLRHTLKSIEGHFITGYADGGDAPDKQLELLPGAVEDARTSLEGHPQTQTRFQKVSDLVKGFESSFGLELLSTVHWVVSKENVRTLDDVVKCTYAWNAGKKKFSQRQIALACDVMAKKGWIENPNIPNTPIP